MHLRVCKGCKRVFTPQLTDDQLLDLFYDPEYREKVEFLQSEYPGFMGVPQLHVPRQIICERCMNDPELEIIKDWMGGVTVRKKTKKRKKDDLPPNEGQTPQDTTF